MKEEFNASDEDIRKVAFTLNIHVNFILTGSKPYPTYEEFMQAVVHRVKEMAGNREAIESKIKKQCLDHWRQEQEEQ